MRIRVDPEVCQGHTLCAMSAPGLFALSEEDGHARAIHEEVPPGQEDRAREAVRSCPEQAILILDSAFLDSAVLDSAPAAEPVR